MLYQLSYTPRPRATYPSGQGRRKVQRTTGSPIQVPLAPVKMRWVAGL